MKRLMTFVLGLTYITCSFAQALSLDWSFQTSDRILAASLIQDETIFVGNEGGDFYALDLQGNEKWKIETGGNIQAKATWVDGNVFFESANVFYLVNAKNGKQIWKFNTGMEPFIFKYEEREWPYKIDPFDDKRSIATYHSGIIYVGSGDGNVYGLNASNGLVVKTYPADENAPVRSSPFVKDDRLYFGDWEGMVYCYSLDSDKLIWKKKTYRGEKPYGTFGGVVSEFLAYDGLLFFGARNYMLNVLDIETGEKEWTYTDAKKGWVIGDPVIYKDTLYIGGSDNYSMLAFDPIIGRPIWSQNGGKNIYTKPIVTEEWVIYTAGNGYNPKDSGAIFLLNRKSGEEIARFDVPEGTFSSPSMFKNLVVFGCYDGKIYSLKVE
ncbi:Outer membrane protein assembly factor BamB, contains PQQ-like beta-propeller repeat [Ekhidna lutea]|uniref:Outer membrane protein assembly factor BamB, contains PQQ-like beta-propeller repeat n=1 Tax=Ekhidna lutea TaxID=447679 RepID=A0A239EJJ0_EKHLU|nr:PQQ-binding-like beta-propeller repeat protein [Ekhidna lutea]SNS44739.1 Outer membrane protein assembly factor BamB, contains PQQ-like beta-propeller repeat [Ekhidna lutea]